MILDLENGVALCRQDHIALEWRKDPEITRRILDKRGKKWAEELNRKRHEIKPSSWNISYLEDKIKELEGLLQ